MKDECSQIADTIKAAHICHHRGEWSPGDPYMEDDLGNLRFLRWCDKFHFQIEQICNKCPYQLRHEILWLNEDHSEGVPANKLCAKYQGKIDSCHNTVEVARICKFVDQNIFGIYVVENDLYEQWWKDKLHEYDI